MDLSYRWLQTLVDGLDASPQAVSDRLAALGAPVDELVPLGEGLGDIVVARVLEAGPHPNADRLSLCRVDAGGDEPLPVVCGAPNVRAGHTYAFAPVGAFLPDGTKIRKAKIRGEYSQGMLCSERELGLGRGHEGIMELSGGEPGEPLVPFLGLDDARIVIDVTPNRPDLLCHAGVARELAADGLGTLALPTGAQDLTLQAGEASASTGSVTIGIEVPDLCFRYLGAVIRGVTIGPSPEWLRGRLRAIGQRPINNVVDATNFVLHELGQPLHAFDLARIGGARIRVRRAQEGERITTLDGEHRKLDPSMMVIADAERPVAVAGVMGGEDSEVGPQTRDVLLECALFDAHSVRSTRRALGLVTDASYRYERGVDPEGMERALRRAVELIVETAGGAADRDVADAVARPFEAGVVPLRPSRVEKVLGVAIPADTIVEHLEPLGFQAVGPGTDGGAGDADGGADDALRFRVPGARSYDVLREVDLIEEVARRHGYERFPQEFRTFRPGTVRTDPMEDLEARLRDLLVARGLFEVHLGGFAPAAEGDVALQLPLSSAESHLRRALLPGLIHRAEHNFARGVRDVRLFEIGTAFAPGDGAPRETRRIAALLTGARAPAHWSSGSEDVDVWDLKGLLAELAGALGLPAPEPAGKAGVPAEIDPGWALRVGPEDGASGVGGRIAARAVDAPRWAGPAWGLEIVLDPEMARRAAPTYVPVPEYPAIERDLALLVPRDLPSGTVEEGVRDAAGPLLEAVDVFDVYTGAGVEEGRRSIAYRLRLRAPDRTLTDEEADRAVARVLERLRERHDVERRE